jgi:hypothetical protein
MSSRLDEKLAQDLLVMPVDAPLVGERVPGGGEDGGVEPAFFGSAVSVASNSR